MSSGTLNFRITNRLNEPATEFSLDYRGVDTPSGVIEGAQVMFTVNDPYSPDDLRMLRAYVEEMNWSEEPAKQLISISGRDIGLYLQRQKFKLDCTIEAAKITKAPDLMGQILSDTGITIGRGQPKMIEVEMPNKYGLSNWYCGSWNTKKDALDWLFHQYRKARGMNKIRWYIDMSGDLRWFEREARETSTPLYRSDPRIISINVRSDATNIVNDITGYGGDKGDIKVHLRDQSSVDQFGLQEGGDINDSTLTTLDQVSEKVREELSNRSKQVYTVSVLFKHYVDYEPGMTFEFPDHSRIGDEVFTLIGYTLEGSPAKARATLEFTTDPLLINPPNTFEALKAVISDAMEDGKTRVGEVVAVDEVNKTADVRVYNGGQVWTTRYV